MATLRERHRERRHTAIMDAAWELAGEKGFDETSVEEIAARAEVGPATVYAYFGSKNELLAALLIRFLEQEADDAEVVLENPPDNIVDGMTVLFMTYLEGMASRCTPKLRTDLYALSMTKRFDYGRYTYELKQRILGQSYRLAAHYKERGQVGEEVSAEETAAMCCSAAVFPMVTFALGLGVDFDTAHTLLRRYLTLTVSGIGRMGQECSET